ncbi:MAG: hypothetical protein ACK55Z_32075, partial [bacterium]
MLLNKNPWHWKITTTTILSEMRAMMMSFQQRNFIKKTEFKKIKWNSIIKISYRLKPSSNSYNMLQTLISKEIKKMKCKN